jgi:dolichol-phosphate mannosyltransferase
MQPNPELSVVIAAYNEEPVITRNLRHIVDELSKRPNVLWEMICVDDGSTDNTRKLIDDFASANPRVRVFHHRRNFGQGRALRTAFDQCQGEVIVTLDADLSYGPEYIFRLMDALRDKNVEIALASAYAKGGMVRNVPFYRHFLSRYGNFYLAKMSRYPISTSTSVVRAYRREVIDTLDLTSDGMELQLEILMKAYLMGFRVCEVPARLEWTDAKADKAVFGRVSKMRILRTIRLYLLMGWLQRPAYIFIILSWLLIIPGTYMAVTVALVTFKILKQKIPLGLSQALHVTLKELVTDYYQSIVFSAAFLVIGILIFAFSLILLQNKFYFEELYRLGQNFRKSNYDRITMTDSQKESDHKEQNINK